VVPAIRRGTGDRLGVPKRQKKEQKSGHSKPARVCRLLRVQGSAGLSMEPSGIERINRRRQTRAANPAGFFVRGHAE